MGYNRVGLVYKLYDLAPKEIEVVEEKKEVYKWLK